VVRKSRRTYGRKQPTSERVVTSAGHSIGNATLGVGNSQSVAELKQDLDTPHAAAPKKQKTRRGSRHRTEVSECTQTGFEKLKAAALQPDKIAAQTPSLTPQNAIGDENVGENQNECQVEHKECLGAPEPTFIPPEPPVAAKHFPYVIPEGVDATVVNPVEGDSGSDTSDGPQMPALVYDAQNTSESPRHPPSRHSELESSARESNTPETPETLENPANELTSLVPQGTRVSAGSDDAPSWMPDEVLAANDPSFRVAPLPSLATLSQDRSTPLEADQPQQLAQPGIDLAPAFTDDPDFQDYPENEEEITEMLSSDEEEGKKSGIAAANTLDADPTMNVRVFEGNIGPLPIHPTRTRTGSRSLIRRTLRAATKLVPRSLPNLRPQVVLEATQTAAAALSSMASAALSKTGLVSGQQNSSNPVDSTEECATVQAISTPDEASDITTTLALPGSPVSGAEAEKQSGGLAHGETTTTESKTHPADEVQSPQDDASQQKPKMPPLVDRSSPKWQDDETAPACNDCEAQFSWFTRKHHCRYCGLVYCHSCSPHNLDGHRMCRKCQELVNR